jgi:hypothetical protein
MKSIWKFPLKVTDTQTVQLPIGSKILSAKTQGEDIVLYALVDTKEIQKEVISVRIFGTGHPVDISTESWHYLDTVLHHGDMLVWHIFYK